MNRVIGVGTTGSGKTTLARQLAERIGCPFVELDALFWNPRWLQTPRETDAWLHKIAPVIPTKAGIQ